ncbi:MAG: hypothetical protein ACRYGR_03455 [Janthinobacterium lividum]
MMKKIFSLLCLIVFISLNVSHADKGLYLIQVTQPEKQRVDITFYPFFSLEDQEESALKALSNKHTLYTYDELQNRETPLQREIGPVIVLIKTQQLGQGGAGGSAQGVEISVSHEDHKILDQVVFKNDDFSKVSVIQKDDVIILSLESNSSHQIKNHEIKLDVKSTLKSYNDIKTQGRTL